MAAARPWAAVGVPPAQEWPVNARHTGSIRAHGTLTILPRAVMRHGCGADSAAADRPPVQKLLPVHAGHTGSTGRTARGRSSHVPGAPTATVSGLGLALAQNNKIIKK